MWENAMERCLSGMYIISGTGIVGGESREKAMRKREPIEVKNKEWVVRRAIYAG